MPGEVQERLGQELAVSQDADHAVLLHHVQAAASRRARRVTYTGCVKPRATTTNRVPAAWALAAVARTVARTITNITRLRCRMAGSLPPSTRSKRGILAGSREPSFGAARHIDMARALWLAAFALIAASCFGGVNGGTSGSPAPTGGESKPATDVIVAYPVGNLVRRRAKLVGCVPGATCSILHLPHDCPVDATCGGTANASRVDQGRPPPAHVPPTRR